MCADKLALTLQSESLVLTSNSPSVTIADSLTALLVSGGLAAPPGGLATYRPQQLYSLFNADVPVTDVQVRMTEVAEHFRRFERATDSSRVIGARDRALRVAFNAFADNMAAFSASCQLSADLITYVCLSSTQRDCQNRQSVSMSVCQFIWRIDKQPSL